MRADDGYICASSAAAAGVGTNRGPDPLDGCGKLAETFRLQRRDDLGSRTGELDRVVHHHCPAGAPH